MKVRFMLNPALMDELGNDQSFRRWLGSAAGEVRAAIPSHLPRGKGGGRRVAAFARKSYHTVDGAGRTVHAEVGTKWRLGHIVEFGSVNNPAYSPVRKAARASGMRFTEGA